MKTLSLSTLAAAGILMSLAAAGFVFAPTGQAQDKSADKPAGKPALTVNLISPQKAEMPFLVQATGNIAAWQEASIGAETGGLRITDVRVNVGDVVEKGQVLATLSTEALEADLAQARANVAEVEANLAEARANAARAREVQGSGSLSQQQIAQLLTTEKTVEARVLAARAMLNAQQIRLKHTSVSAPDDGSISARGATVGAVVPQGQELFRLIRGNRLEWRAEVTSAEIAQIRPGHTATVTSATGSSISGRVRMIAPTVDPQTRNVLVYVDLPANAMRDGNFKSGMFARGEFSTGGSRVLTLPLAAISLRDGFSFIFALGGDSRVKQVKVQLGRRSGERVEVKGPLNGSERVVASGAAFLADGDLVHVVNQ